MKIKEIIRATYIEIGKLSLQRNEKFADIEKLECKIVNYLQAIDLLNR